MTQDEFFEKMLGLSERAVNALESIAAPEPEPQTFEDDRDELGPVFACPKCGEQDRIENTSAPGALGRRTCLSCGESFQLQHQEVR